VDILGNTGVHLHRVENVRLVGVEELDRRIGEGGAGIIEILDRFRDLGARREEVADYWLIDPASC
jgi:hypothetical protein